MIRAKKRLIFLVILFLILITLFTDIRFKTVKHFTQIYTYPEWKLNENNGFRLAFLEFMNKKSFLPFYLELYIIDSENKKILLDKGFKKAELYNKEFKITSLKEGNAKIKGIIKYKDNIVEDFNLPIKIIKEYSPININLAPKVTTEINNDFSQEDQITYYPRFKEPSNKTCNKENIYIQLFGYPKDFAFSEKNKIFLLFTCPDYTPINLTAKINFSDFTSKRKEITLKSDINGIMSFDEYIYRTGGYIYIKSPYFGMKKKVFSLSDDKTSVLTDKDIYPKGSNVKITVKTYKKIKELFFNASIGKSWILNKKINVSKGKKEIKFTVPEYFEGFIEFSVHKGYSYPKDSSFKKIYVGNKNNLKKALRKLKNKYIDNILNNQTDNFIFYRLIFSQLDKNNLDTLKIFDSYLSQQKKLDSNREKYQAVLWYLIFLISVLIIITIFLTSYKSIKESNEKIEFQYRKKGGFVYLYIFISLLTVFMILILWILKIV